MDRPALEAPPLHTLRLIARQPWRHYVTSQRSAHLLARLPVAWNWRSAVLSADAGLLVIVAKRLDASRCHLVWRWAWAQATLCSMWTQLPPEQRAHPPSPSFGPCLLWPNGWMDEDATWYGSRPRPRPHCIRRGPSSARKGHISSPSFRPMSIVAIVAHVSYCWALVLVCHTPFVYHHSVKKFGDSTPVHSYWCRPQLRIINSIYIGTDWVQLSVFFSKNRAA